jgi:hypothetical protein
MSRTSLAAIGLSSCLTFILSCSQAPTSPTQLSGSTAASPAVAVTAMAGHAGHSQHMTADALSAAETHQAIADVRRFLAPFHNFDKAVEFGYRVAAPGENVCISDPARGGMGYHYTRFDKDLIGDGVVSLLEPEFLVYSPTQNGGRRLSAVDYFVPFDTWDDPDPPSLLGVPFAREEAFGAWVLHIWAFWPNPIGIFENYNPAVPLCP